MAEGGKEEEVLARYRRLMSRLMDDARALAALAIPARQRSGRELKDALQKGTEPRYDLRIIVLGHLSAGKTTVIQRLLKVAFDMRNTKTTNGIVVTKKGGIRLKDGEWLDKSVNKDSAELLKRMKAVTLSTDVPNSSQDWEKTSGKEEMVSDPEAEKDASKLKRMLKEEDIICRLLIWDFAGQAIFNSCHQMFMSYRAVYLLVFDISKSLEYEINDDDVFILGSQRRMSIKEFTVFLLNSIHMYHGQEKNAFPKVFLIGTHGDLVDKQIAQQRMKALKRAISKASKLQRHIVGSFIVDNTVSDDLELKNLKQAIFERVQKESFWGEKVPSSWMPLEKKILSQRDDKNKRVLTLQEIQGLNQSCYVKLQSDAEIQAFLKFQNSLGNMMFFGGNDPSNLVILDPQWLIDSLKQIITHEQFFVRPAGLDEAWEEFKESAILRKQLIQAVWSKNEDKTFIKHMEKILEILQSTDIICTPKIYNTMGNTEEVDYVIVPSILKPVQEGTRILKAYKTLSQSKSSTLCFVFKDNFMPPAIFARIQAACIKEYRIRKKSNQSLIFHQAAVFKLNKEYDLHLEQYLHTIRVTIISIWEEHMNSQLCSCVLSFIEEKLMEITKLYHAFDEETELPYYQAIECGQENENLDGLIPWKDLKASKRYICENHEPEKWHKFFTSDLLDVWTGNVSLSPQKAMHLDFPRFDGEPLRREQKELDIRGFGRIARWISNEGLRLTASTVLNEAEIDRATIENTNNVIDQNFDILMNWAMKNKDDLSIAKLQENFKEAKQDVNSDRLREALADKDYTGCFGSVPDEFLDTILNDMSVDLICQRTGKQYKQLFIELGLHPESIERVVMEKNRVIERTRALLREWMRWKQAAATHRAVGQAIVEVGMDISIIQDWYSD